MSPLRRIAGSPGAVGLWSAVLGAALWFAPPALATRVQGVAWDLLRPGLQLAHHTQRELQSAWARRRDAEVQALQTRLTELQSELAAEQTRTRRLAAQMLLARESNGESTGDRLFHPAIVDAAVLGESLSAAWRQGTVLDRGAAQGVRESAVVLHSPRPLVDRGQRDQLAAEDMLLLGRAVLGKIDTVGRWTSTFLPITDPAYRGRAQLVRQTDTGPQWGATGLLRGDGAVCRLEGVPGNESVREGDLVFTAERDAALGTALSYGTVIEAELGMDDREWRIVVQPAAQLTTTTEVQVLRAALNPARLWAH